MKTRTILADSDKNRNQAFYKELKQKVKDLDIGLVIINAGNMFIGEFETRDPKNLETMLNTNDY